MLRSLAGLVPSANLKLIASYEWTWLTRLKSNRLTNLDRTGNQLICQVNIAASGTVVHLKGYGFIQVFKIVAPDGDIDYWATNDLKMSELQRLQWAECEWSVEEYHRGLKQCCGVEKAQVRSRAFSTQSYWFSHSSLLAPGDALVQYWYQLL